MKIVTYEPGELWDFFQEKKHYLRTHTVTIAEDPDLDVSIFLTAEEYSSGILPALIVWVDQKEEVNEVCLNKDDLEDTAQMLYGDYLDEDNVIQMALDKEDEEKLAQLDEIEQREGDLFDAAMDFLEVICNGRLEKIVSPVEAEEICDDIVNRVCEHLYTEYNISVPRPMMLEDEDGNEFFEKFPYDCLTFDD